MTEWGDAELLALSRRRPEKFLPVWDHHAPAVFTYMAGRAGRAAAGELLGEVRNRAFEQRARYDHRQGDARRWFFGIAKNVLHERRRFREREDRALERLGLWPGDSQSPIDDVDERLWAAWALRVVERVVEGLPPGERDVVVLVAYEDRSYAEVSDRLDIPTGTVGSRLNSVRQKIRDALAQEDRQPPGPHATGGSVR